MLVQDFLELSARRLPDKVALVCRGRGFTYSEIDSHANVLANALRARGLMPGDRACVFLQNCAEAVIALFAILKAGGVFVMVNRSTKGDKLSYILNNSGSRILLTDRRAIHDLQPNRENPRQQQEIQSLNAIVLTGSASAGSDSPEPTFSFADIRPRQPTEATLYGFDLNCLTPAHNLGSADRPPRANIDLDLACLIYTSGTTGDPKGVMSDHSNVVFAANSITQYLGSGENDVVIDVLPLSFDYGLYQVLMTFKVGGRLILEKGFAFPAEFLKAMQVEKVTGFPGVPTLFAILLKMDLSGFDLSSLRYITNTAAALPPSHIVELRHKFPTATIYSMYGLTETKRTLYLPPELLDKKPGSVGIAIPGTQVWIEDESGHRLGPGQTGELVIRGRHVMRGYWAAPEASAARFRPGPLPGERVCYSGDLFRMDQDGCMYFVSRKDDIIKSRGEKVAPKEVETVLYSLKPVVEAAVIGVPDPLLGQAIKAYVVLNDHEVTPAQIIAHCKAHLEDFMVPKYVEILDELPKTASGKIRKAALT